MEALNTARMLGYEKIVWIDDHFIIEKDHLKNYFIDNKLIVLQCDFNDNNFLDIFKKYGYDDEFLENLEYEVEQYIENSNIDTIRGFREIVLKQETAQEDAGNKELNLENIEEICKLLNISESEQLHFLHAESYISENIDNDENILYMIDLNEGTTNSRRGLELINFLYSKNSKSTTVLVTHDADENTEETLERKLFEEEPINKNIAFSVISKSKFYNLDVINDSINIALKRITLRKNLMDVLNNANQTIIDSYAIVKEKLLDISPEQLEHHVMEKSLIEGVSELHIIERSITSFLSKEIKKYFFNENISKNILKIRKLKNIQINNAEIKINDCLRDFRNNEIWEEGEFINSSFMPVFCGDVFEYTKNNKSEKYILLAQPCDILIRKSGNRKLRTAFFIPINEVKKYKTITTEVFIKNKNLSRPSDENNFFDNYVNTAVELENLKNKNKVLPQLKLKNLDYFISGNKYSCDFSSYFNVNLSIIDLCSLNQDGSVTLHKDIEQSEVLLPGLRVISNNFIKYLEEKSETLEIANKNLECILSLDVPKTKKLNPYPVLIESNKLSWEIKRIGRLKTPYSTDLLKVFMDVFSRNAFDMEFVDE